MRERGSSKHFKDVPRASARNKKTRNPGFVSGDHWNTCDLCGCAVRNSDSRKTWDGLVVCPDDWEPRHEQDFVRSRDDQQRPEGLVRPEPEDLSVGPTYPAPTSTIPPGDNDNDL